MPPTINLDNPDIEAGCDLVIYLSSVLFDRNLIIINFNPSYIEFIVMKMYTPILIYIYKLTISKQDYVPNKAHHYKPEEIPTAILSDNLGFGTAIYLICYLVCYLINIYIQVVTTLQLYLESISRLNLLV